MLAVLKAMFLVLVMLAGIAGAVLWRGWQLGTARERTRAVTLAVAPSDSLVPRGRHLAELACVSCHSSNGRLPLSGGDRNVLAGRGRFSLGEAKAPNLTGAGVLPRTDVPRLARAIREGIGHDGRTLLVMPAHRFRHLSDRDAAALVAYLQDELAVPSPGLPRRFTPAGYAALALGRVPLAKQPRVDGPIRHVPEGSPEYGRYLARYLGCNDCHGADFRGGRERSLEHPGPNLVQITNEQPLAVFERALRRGVSTSGRTMKREEMPRYPALSDSELVAIYRYVREGAIWD